MHVLLKHPLVDCDLEEAALWYYHHDPAIADRFIDESQRLMRVILENPLRFTIRFADVRRARLAGFPHSLYFTLENEAVHILALIHGAREMERVLSSRKSQIT